MALSSASRRVSPLCTRSSDDLVSFLLALLLASFIYILELANSEVPDSAWHLK